jgi:hypothetical protein
MKGLKYILGFFIILISFSISAQSSEEPTLIEKWKIKKSERKAKKRAKAAYKELERNYKQRQHDHYMMQDERTKQRMRDGQKQARRQVSGRTHSWWWRMRNRL